LKTGDRVILVIYISSPQNILVLRIMALVYSYYNHSLKHAPDNFCRHWCFCGSPYPLMKMECYKLN